MNEVKLVASGLIALLFVFLPLLLHRAGTTVRRFVMPILPLSCAVLFLILDRALLLPAAEILVVLGAYLFFVFRVAGSIELQLRFAPTPINNTIYLALSALAANVIGGIGATLIFLGPIVHANRDRRHLRHIPIFFLVTVTQLGGLVSPMGAPHLYLLHSLGAPVEQFLHLVPIWLGIQGTLLLVFLAYDVAVLSNEPVQSDPRANLYDDLHRALQQQQVPQSLLLRTIDYLEAPTAYFRGGIAIFLIPLGLGAIAIAGELGNPYHWREICLLLVGTAAGLGRFGRSDPEHDDAPPHRSAVALLVNGSIFFASVAVVFLPLWARSLAASGDARMLVAELPLWTGLVALSGLLDNTTAVLAVLVTKLEPAGPLLAGPMAVPEAWRELLMTKASFIWLAVAPCVLGGLTYASDVANLIVRRVSAENGITMPGFFVYTASVAPILVVAALPAAAIVLLLPG